MIYIAHRGLSSVAPENTIKAFELVDANTHYQAIECDIQTTKDGTFIVFHDDDLKRMLGINKKVREVTYDEIKDLPIKSGSNHKTYHPQYIPTLEMFLNICQNQQKIAQIEIKSVHDIEQLNELMSILDTYDMLSYEIISFNLNYLKYLRAITNRPLRLLSQTLSDEKIYEARLHELSIGIDYKYLDHTLFKTLKKQGFNVLVYTVDQKNTAKKFEKMGVDALTTNRL